MNCLNDFNRVKVAATLNGMNASEAETIITVYFECENSTKHSVNRLGTHQRGIFKRKVRIVYTSSQNTYHR